MNAIIGTMIFVAVIHCLGILVCLLGTGLKLGKRGPKFEDTKFFLKTVSRQPFLDETKKASRLTVRVALLLVSLGI